MTHAGIVVLYDTVVHSTYVLSDREDMMPCPICQIAFTDSSAALTHAHNCLMAQDDVITRTIERDKKDRADFLTMVHIKYLLSLTKQVVPWNGTPYENLFIAVIRAMDEFIKSLDVSKDVLKASDSLAAPLPAAALGPTSTSNLLVRGVDAGLSETSAQPLDQMEVPPTLCLRILDESQSEKSDELFEPADGLIEQVTIHLLDSASYTNRRDRSAPPPFFVLDPNHIKNVKCEYCGKCARNETLPFADCNFCNDSPS